MDDPITPDDFEKQVMSLLANKLLSVSHVARELKVRRDVAAGYLEALKNQGKLEFHRVGRSNVYTVARRGR